MKEKRIVHRVEDGMDRREIYCSTYQMRNPFHSFADAVASELDVFCYFQHAFAADLCPPKGRILDMCCGRGLLLPFLRFRNARPSLYVGVDLHPANAPWRHGADPRRRGTVPKNEGWGFETVFVEASVEEMIGPLEAALSSPPIFDLIVFTSSIEHMQPSAQQAALHQAAGVAHNQTILLLTCPVTPETQDGYDCQYRAHVYEPKEEELSTWLHAAGWRIVHSFGLVTKITATKERLRGTALQEAKRLLRQMPRELALPVIAALYPECATEKAYLCHLGTAGKASRLSSPSLRNVRESEGLLRGLVE